MFFSLHHSPLFIPVHSPSPHLQLYLDGYHEAAFFLFLTFCIKLSLFYNSIFNSLSLSLTHLPSSYFIFPNNCRGDDTSGEARLRSDWNKHVMKDIVAPLYALLLVYACTYLQDLVLSATATATAGDGVRVSNATDECSTIPEVLILYELSLYLT